MSTLKRSAMQAVVWSYAGTIAKAVLQLCVQISLARILGPEPFGTVAAALLFVSFLCLVIDLGLGAALVQTRDPGEAVIAAVWFRTTAAGAACMVLLILLAAGLGGLGMNPAIVFAAEALSPVVLLQGATIVPLALLRRRLDMRAIQIAQIGGYFAGFLVAGVGLAMVRHDVMPLIAAWLVCYAVTLLLALLLARTWLLPRPGAPIGFLGGFGIRVMVTNLLNWGLENLDNVAVGSAFGPRALGLYSTSYNLVRMPTNQLVVALQGPMFAATARAHEQQRKLAAPFLAALSAIAAVSACIFGTVAVFAPTVILGLIGPKWSEAAGILTPLSLAMIFHSMMAICGPVMAGAGHPQHEMRVQGLTLIFFMAAIALASFGTILTLAWMVLVIYALRSALMLMAVSKVLQFDLGLVVPVIIRAAALALAVIACSALALEALPAGLPAPGRLAVLVAAAFASLVASLYCWPRPFLGAQLCDFIAQATQSLPLPGPVWLPFHRRLRG